VAGQAEGQQEGDREAGQRDAGGPPAGRAGCGTDPSRPGPQVFVQEGGGEPEDHQAQQQELAVAGGEGVAEQGRVGQRVQARARAVGALDDEQQPGRDGGDRPAGGQQPAGPRLAQAGGPEQEQEEPDTQQQHRPGVAGAADHGVEQRDSRVPGGLGGGRAGGDADAEGEGPRHGVPVG
jgi:hypothetical protein